MKTRFALLIVLLSVASAPRFASAQEAIPEENNSDAAVIEALPRRMMTRGLNGRKGINDLKSKAMDNSFQSPEEMGPEGMCPEGGTCGIYDSDADRYAYAMDQGATPSSRSVPMHQPRPVNAAMAVMNSGPHQQLALGAITQAQTIIHSTLAMTEPAVAAALGTALTVGGEWVNHSFAAQEEMLNQSRQSPEVEELWQYTVDACVSKQSDKADQVSAVLACNGPELNFAVLPEFTPPDGKAPTGKDANKTIYLSDLLVNVPGKSIGFLTSLKTDFTGFAGDYKYSLQTAAGSDGAGGGSRVLLNYERVPVAPDFRLSKMIFEETVRVYTQLNQITQKYCHFASGDDTNDFIDAWNVDPGSITGFAKSGSKFKTTDDELALVSMTEFTPDRRLIDAFFKLYQQSYGAKDLTDLRQKVSNGKIKLNCDLLITDIDQNKQAIERMLTDPTYEQFVNERVIAFYRYAQHIARGHVYGRYLNIISRINALPNGGGQHFAKTRAMELIFQALGRNDPEAMRKANLESLRELEHMLLAGQHIGSGGKGNAVGVTLNNNNRGGAPGTN